MVPILGPGDITTRFTILANTKGSNIPPDIKLNPGTDVVIYIGNLTQRSTLSEFFIALGILASLNAPLKLVIPGPNDWTLDDAAYQARITSTSTSTSTNTNTNTTAKATNTTTTTTATHEEKKKKKKKDTTGTKMGTVPRSAPGPPLVANEEAMKYVVYGQPGQARDLFYSSAQARLNGVYLFDREGRQDFALSNHACMSVYASPWGMLVEDETKAEAEAEGGRDGEERDGEEEVKDHDQDGD